MIRKLTNEDEKKVIEFLREEEAFNLFIIGDIENFGFDSEFQELWGSFNKSEELEGVLLRYYESYIPYFKTGTSDIDGFKEIINKDNRKRILSGKSDIVSKFDGIFKKANCKETYFCELNSSEQLKECIYDVKEATEDDATRVSELIGQIKEFSFSAALTPERIKKKIQDKEGRIYYIENEEKELVSVAQTTAENKYSAMIVGVATKESERNKGYVSSCISKLCEDVLKEGKSLCLFYDNPKAGRIYHNIGFETIGKWTMLIEEEKSS